MNTSKVRDILHAKKLERIKAAEAEASRLINTIGINSQSKLIALAMMYWCEGGKNDRSIQFTNSDPKLAKAFISLLKDIFFVDQKMIRVCIHLHDYHKENEIRMFWSEALGVPQSQFVNSFHKKSKHLYSKKDYKGCVQIKYHNSHITRVLLAFAQKLINLYI